MPYQIPRQRVVINQLSFLPSTNEQRADKTVEEFAEDSGSDVPVGGKVLGPEVFSESRGGSESVDCVAVGFGHLHRWAWEREECATWGRGKFNKGGAWARREKSDYRWLGRRSQKRCSKNRVRKVLEFRANALLATIALCIKPSRINLSRNLFPRWRVSTGRTPSKVRIIRGLLTRGIARD